MSKNVKFPKIKKSLCEREHISRSVHRKAIQESTGMNRWQAWVAKRSYGEDTRHLLLAYGFLRGLPYVACEKKCDDKNLPSARSIASAAGEQGVNLDVEAVKTWIAETSYVAPEPVPVTAPVLAVPMPESEPKGFFARLFRRTA